MRKAMFVASALLLAASGLAAQNSQNTQPSVADAARKTREAKKPEAKSGKVFDNDNLPSGTNVNVVGTEAPAAAPGALPSDSSKQSLEQQEQAWRARFARARGQLDRDQATLDVMQREFDRLQLEYYPNDPTKQLQQSVSRSDINAQRAKIEKKKADVAADKAAISDLEDALRHAGGDPGWAR